MIISPKRQQFYLFSSYPFQLEKILRKRNQHRFFTQESTTSSKPAHSPTVPALSNTFAQADCGVKEGRAEISLTYLLQNPKPFQLRNYRGHLLEDYLKSIQDKTFTPLQKDALIGTLLGDATLQYCNGTYPHLKFEQGGANIKKGDLTYIQLLYSIFEEFVGTYPKIRLKDGKPHSYFFRTFRSKKFDFYAKQFYRIDAMGRRKKVVPKNIHQWLTPQALAFWFQDDGSKHSSGYVLHTENFCLPDVIVLQQARGLFS